MDIASDGKEAIDIFPILVFTCTPVRRCSARLLPKVRLTSTNSKMSTITPAINPTINTHHMGIPKKLDDPCPLPGVGEAVGVPLFPLDNLAVAICAKTVGA